MKVFPTWLIALLVAGFTWSPAHAGPWVQIQKHLSPSSMGSDFGGSVAIERNIALVGDPGNNFDTGAAYVYERNTSGVWTLIATLQAPGGVSGSRFGTSVDLHVTSTACRAIVGASSANLFKGAAHIYECSNWTQPQTITASDAMASDSFGTSVSVSDTRALVGAIGNDGGGVSNAGAAYLFTRNGSGVWQQTQKLLASPLDAASNFGTSVSISGTRAVVGAPTGGDSSHGTAHIFELAGTAWQQQALFTGSALDELGRSVSISGIYVLAGAHRDDSVAANSGAVYVYRKGTSGWVQDAKLKALDAQATDQFGFSSHILNDWAVVGALSEDQGGFSAGAAYIFERTPCAVWVQRGKVIANDASVSANLGQSVQIGARTSTSGVLKLFMTALAGAPGAGAAGAAYWFETEIPAYESPCQEPQPEEPKSEP